MLITCNDYDPFQFFFKRHCAAMVYLQQTDWMLVLETDIGVVNPNHCIEEWIDDRVKVILYERFINGEISPVSYMVRNTHYAMEFLQKWANMEFSAENSPSVVDKGALQIHVMKSVIPDAVQNAENCAAMLVDVNNYDTYFSYVSCVKQGLGATKIWPKKIRILRRAHAWVRDGSLSENRWSDVDFMFHGWRGNSVRVGNAPFEEMLELKKCGEGEEAWKWKRGSHVPVVQIKEKLIEFERTFAEKYPKQATDVTWLKMPDVKKCYPHCDTMG
ncbi:hypothetical protein Q1695_014746 [Nippostrongylus brasiliensis]|nr:hypothetical protein Q1695_014746 [Nippostrongylus brasiliensis]